MTYTDYFLKFANKAEAESKFLAAGIGLDAEGKLPSYTLALHTPMAIDVLFGTGIKMRDTGATEPDGMGGMQPVLEPVAGYHVNIRVFGTIPAALEPYALDPDPLNPVCRFAG